ncbi:hypothetical protein HG772_003902 [Salmonella enterica]|nr:hypothetical protein [Salmonella enterica]ECZ5385768.1 hypothetical protein [Salmonella enterica subsp. enterica serovar Montevideo]ECF6666152.1 hypothetical protein [Salmonella enterica]EFS0968978.1 hypothetical protein [Salmonella enterica]EGG9437131.1 hypothetical protein [Salmonella enterica]
MIKKKQLTDQRGVSFIELILTVIISLPCIIFVQDQIISVFNNVIARNVLASYKEIALYIEGSPLWTTFTKSDYYVKLDTSNILSNKFFDINLLDNRVQFYTKSDGILHPDGVRGYYIIGILSQPETLKISPVSIYNALGSNAGYIENGYIHSVSGSFKPVNINSDPALRNIDTKKTNIIFYDFFFKKIETSEDYFLKADSISMEDQPDNEIRISFCNSSCLNGKIFFSWLFYGMNDLSIFIDKINDMSISQPIKLATPPLAGFYEISVSQLLSALRASGYTLSDYDNFSIGFGITGIDSDGHSIHSTFKDSLYLIK